MDTEQRNLAHAIVSEKASEDPGNERAYLAILDILEAVDTTDMSLDEIGDYFDLHGTHNQKSHGKKGRSGGRKRWEGGGRKKGRAPDKTRFGKGPLGTKGNPIVTNDVNAAALHLAKGKHVELNTPRQVSTLTKKLKQMVDSAEARGRRAPTIDLCKVSVKGTNLFCTESKGIPRILMPQLKSADVRPGSKADALPRDKRGEVSVEGKFKDYLVGKGVKVEGGTEPAAYLKATQNELNGGKTADIAAYLRGGGEIEGPPLFVSKDNYIVDGHHRWAAQVAVDYDDGDPTNGIPIDIDRIDMPIIELLAEANDFAEEWGLPRAGVAGGFGNFTEEEGLAGLDYIDLEPGEGLDLAEEDLDEFLSIALAETFSKPGTADVTPADRKKLAGLLKHYAKKAHPFGACKRDQMKHGLTEDHANRRCAVLKDLIKGTTKWRKGGSKSKSDMSYVEFAEVEEVGAALTEEFLDELWEMDVPEEGVDFALQPGQSVEWGEGEGIGHGIVMESDTSTGNVNVHTCEVIERPGRPAGLSPTGQTIKIDGSKLRRSSLKPVGETPVGPERVDERGANFTPPPEASRTAVMAMYDARETHPELPSAVVLSLANGEELDEDDIAELAEFFEEDGADLSDDDEDVVYRMYGGDAMREWVVDMHASHNQKTHGSWSSQNQFKSKARGGGLEDWAKGVEKSRAGGGRMAARAGRRDPVDIGGGSGSKRGVEVHRDDIVEVEIDGKKTKARVTAPGPAGSKVGVRPITRGKEGEAVAVPHDKITGKSKEGYLSTAIRETGGKRTKEDLYSDVAGAVEEKIDEMELGDEFEGKLPAKTAGDTRAALRTFRELARRTPTEDGAREAANAALKKAKTKYAKDKVIEAARHADVAYDDDAATGSKTGSGGSKYGKVVMPKGWHSGPPLPGEEGHGQLEKAVPEKPSPKALRVMTDGVEKAEKIAEKAFPDEVEELRFRAATFSGLADDAPLAKHFERLAKQPSFMHRDFARDFMVDVGELARRANKSKGGDFSFDFGLHHYPDKGKAAGGKPGGGGKLGTKKVSALSEGDIVVLGNKTAEVVSLTKKGDRIQFKIKGSPKTYSYKATQTVFTRDSADMSSLTENPFADMSVQLPVDFADAEFMDAAATSLGKRRWLKHILPIGKINYKGTVLDFGKKFHERLVENFKKKPFDQVPFFKVDADNRHNSDPDNFRGEVQDLMLKDDGTYAVIETNEKGTEHLEKINPKLGTSVRVRFDFKRPADNKAFGPVLEHLAGTTLPHVPGLKNWTPATDLSGVVEFSSEQGDAPGAVEVEDLTSCSFIEEASRGGEVAEMEDGNTDPNNSQKEVTQMSDHVDPNNIDLSEVPDEMRTVMEALMEREKKATDLAQQAIDRMQQSDRQRYEDSVRHRLAELSQAGVDPVKIESATPLLLDMAYAGSEVVVDMSDDGNGGQTEVKSKRDDLIWKILENSKGDLSFTEEGQASRTRPGVAGADLTEDQIIEEWKRFRGENGGGE